MLFEILVLIAVCWNAFDRPRGQNSKVTSVLLRDGMGFFGVSLIKAAQKFFGTDFDHF